MNTDCSVLDFLPNKKNYTVLFYVYRTLRYYRYDLFSTTSVPKLLLPLSSIKCRNRGYFLFGFKCRIYVEFYFTGTGIKIKSTYNK